MPKRPTSFFHHQGTNWLYAVKLVFEDTNVLVSLDDCTAPKDVKGHMGQLVNLAISARHAGISV